MPPRQHPTPTWNEVFDQLGLIVTDRGILLSCGATGVGLTSAVKAGFLVRPRRDHYALPGTLTAIIQAVRVGGRLRCVSALQLLDSVLNRGLLSLDELSARLRQLTEAQVALLCQLDGRAEAGQEFILKLLMRQLGLQWELKVNVSGVGRVDMIVEGILILEAHSRLAHDGWELHVRDRNRDIDSAWQGYLSLRPAYQRTMFDATAVQEAILAPLAAWNHHRVHII